MAAEARLTGDAAEEVERARCHAIYRLGFGVSGCMVGGEILGWSLPLVAAVLAVTLIANADRPPRLLQGFLVFVVVVVSTAVLQLVSGLLVEVPAAFVAVICLILLLTFYAHWRGAPPVVTLLTQLAAVSIPLYSIISPSAATAFSYLLWEAAFIAVLVVWIAFALFPARTDRPRGASTRLRLDGPTAFRRASLDTLILLPMLLWHFFEAPETYAFYTMFVAILLLREYSEAERGQLAGVHFRAALMGGIVGVVAYLVVVSNDTFAVYTAITLAVCLIFASEVMKGGRHGATMLLAFSTFLITFGLGTTEFVSATEYLATRLGRLVFGILYVVAAVSLVSGLYRRRESRRDGTAGAA
jgi:hypothetical protein